MTNLNANQRRALDRINRSWQKKKTNKRGLLKSLVHHMTAGALMRAGMVELVSSYPEARYVPTEAGWARAAEMAAPRNVGGQVNVYATGPMVEKGTDDKWTTYYDDRQLAIIEGPNGVVITGGEGVHHIFDSMSDQCELDIVKNDGKDYICRHGTVEVPIADIVAKCKSKQVALSEFIRRFGPRLETNYHLLLRSLEKIGLNPEDYPRGEEG